MWHVYDFRLYFSSWEAFKDKAQTLENVSFGSEHALFETEPTKWFPVSNAPYMLCTTHFHLKICSHNLCYFFVQYFVDVFQKVESWCPWNSWYQILKGHATFVECLECIQPYSCLSTSNSTHFFCLLLLIILIFFLESAFRTLHITNELEVTLQFLEIWWRW